MVLENSIGLELYVATPRFPDSEQYLDSEVLLALIKGHTLEKRIWLVRLDDLSGHLEFFECIKSREQQTKLPFLVRIHNDETGIVSGDTGLEEVIDVLNSMYRWGGKLVNITLELEILLLTIQISNINILKHFLKKSCSSNPTQK